MKTNHRLVYSTAFALAILCTGFLVYNMLAMSIYKEQVFLERGTITTGIEMSILIGFVLVLIFNIVSLLWVSSRIRQTQEVVKREWGILILGVLCLILMVGEKVMVDEIGREYVQGWEVVGEWIILYIFLSIQLLYNVVILQQVYQTYVNQRCKSSA